MMLIVKGVVKGAENLITTSATKRRARPLAGVFALHKAMKQFFSAKTRPAVPVLLCSLLLWSGLSSAQTPEFLADDIPLDVDSIYHDFAPEAEYSDITRQILYYLIRLHYTSIDIDDEFSETIFDNFIDALDGSRFYFTAEDMASFEQYRYQFDDLLVQGDLSAGYYIYNIYQMRIIERLVYTLKRLEEDPTPFDFTVDEYILVDRSEEPWPANQAELEDVWRKQLKSNVLSYIIDDETEEEAREKLTKRFRSQLSQVLKTNDLDVFQRYMDAMTMAIDPHTQYMAPRAAENFNMNMSLQLEGIGAVLTTEDESTKVVSIVTGGPADLAGELKPNDKIIGVAQAEGDFVDVIGWRVDDVVQLIRGEKGSVVRLNVIPESATSDLETRVIKITRDVVKLEDQSAKKEIIQVDQNGEQYTVGVIDLPTFYIDFAGKQQGLPDFRSSSRDVRNLLEELKQEGVDGVVMDLRGNGGGSLTEANELAGLFIRSGATVQVMDADGNNTIQGDTNPEIVYDGPLVVLVDHLSASASEIFAGAIQDYERGIVIGGQTFGKGTVQEIVGLGDGQLKLTRAKFYRISGESTQHKGVMPDIEMPFELDAIEDLGESSLPTALPWDVIDPQYFRAYADLSPIIPTLNTRLQARIADDPDFEYFRARIQRSIENRENNTLPISAQKLLEEQAENDAWRLETENKLRIAKGKEPFASVAEMDGEDTESEDLASSVDNTPTNPEQNPGTLNPPLSGGDTGETRESDVLEESLLAPSDAPVVADEESTDSEAVNTEEAIASEDADEVAEEEEEEPDPYLVQSGLVIADMIELIQDNRLSLLAQ